MALVPLAANRFLEMMSELTVGWLLLDGAVIAARRSCARSPPTHPDRAFYAGKIARGAVLRAQRAARRRAQGPAHRRRRPQSPLDIPDAAFATVE